MRKKEYRKPEVFIERFELSQHIADCMHSMKPNTAIREGCSADSTDPEWEAEQVFYLCPGWPKTSACKVDGEDMYCLTKGGSNTFVFIS